jgi:putative DNA primase/helicase
VLSSEDGSADTLVPRLMAYGADLSKVHRVRGLTQGISNSKEDFQEVDKLTLSALINGLRQSLNEHNNVRMIFIDPLSAYLDVRNAHSEAEIRSALEPLADFAEEYEIAILAIAHVNKSSTDNAMDKISGSKGVVAQARTCYMAIKVSPEMGEQDNYLAKVKSNISGTEASQGLTYRIESEVIQNSAGEKIETSKVQWTGTCPDTASQILKKRSKDMGQKQRISAELWLVEFLRDGPRIAADVRKAGKAVGHSDRTLDRARNDLGFTSQRIGFGGSTVWFNKKQYEQFQELLDQDIPANEALCHLDSKCGSEPIDVEATRLDDEQAATNDQEYANE